MDVRCCGCGTKPANFGLPRFRLMAAKYLCWCFLANDSRPFSIKVDDATTVDELKKKIKEENPVDLKDIDARSLNLYHVNLKFDDPVEDGHITQANKAFQDLSKCKQLKPHFELSTIEHGFPKGMLHILVQTPEGESIDCGGVVLMADVVNTLLSVRPTTPPNHPQSSPRIPFTPPQKADEGIEGRVSQFAIKLKRTFKEFLRNNVQLPLWQPPLDLADGTRSHITELKIPITSSSSKVPSLLLHNLGQPSHDPQLAERVDRLFQLDSK